MENFRVEQRRFSQNLYGHYCNKVRDLGLEPVSYMKFVDYFDRVANLDLNKRDVMNYLISLTLYKNKE